ncbi:MAG: porphobilinogen synthase [Bdellovibrionales bacterium]|nr:porphobilinogen synthase [Bdellovibrionales bacterium]
MTGAFPYTRLRRNRQSDWVRRLVRETTVTVDDLIWPVFIVDGKDQKQPISSMPGVDRLSIDLLVEKAKQASDFGIPVIALFPYTDPSLKTERAEEAFNPNNLVCRAVSELKKVIPHVGIMCDVALDPYTSHGHDGIMVGNEIDNDLTLEAVVKQSLNQAKAGCDILGPSEMMDGRVGVMRDALEEGGFKNTLIMSYSAKYASKFYGPFRDAVGSKGALKGDKKTYQQDPANSDEALREVALDLDEGADMVMIKPGLPYLDIIRRVKDNFGVPTFAYHVSGEYAMIKAAGEKGWLDADACMFESIQSIKRAGADGILTYYAFDLAQKLQGKKS